MGQSALLSYLPLFATQSLGLSAVGAGGLLGLAQAGGAAGRLAFGAASDRWFKGRRVPSLVLISAVTAGSFLLLAGSLLTSPTLAAVAVFGAGVGALGWVGLYMVLAAELGGPRHAGLMSGASLAFLLTGILAGGPLFGFVLERADSYTHAWTVFALIAALVGAALWAGGTAIHHECRRATDDEHGRA